MLVTLKGYGDESADQTNHRVFAIATVLGSEKEWRPAIREWLRRTRGIPFHATDCESIPSKRVDPEKHAENLKLYEDLTKILARSGLVGFAAVLDLEAFKAVFPEAQDYTWAYYKCFADVVGAAARTAFDFNNNPVEECDVRLEFTFDSRLESNGTAGHLYTLLSAHPDWADAGILDTNVAFEGGTSESRLEMGDLLAREAMKEVDRRITGAPPRVRASFRELDGTGKFRLIERRRDYWEHLRSVVERPESAALEQEYRAWLIEKGQVQHGRAVATMVSWIQFNAWRDNKGVIRKRGAAGSAWGPWPPSV